MLPLRPLFGASAGLLLGLFDVSNRQDLKTESCLIRKVSELWVAVFIVFRMLLVSAFQALKISRSLPNLGLFRTTFQCCRSKLRAILDYAFED